MHLDEPGRAQAERLADLLGEAGIAAIYSSPLERASVTAAPLARRLGLPIVEIADLVDMEFGAWTGREVQAMGPDPQWRSFNQMRSLARPPGGESAGAVQHRMVAALSAIVETHPDEPVAVFGHADPIRYTLAYLLGMPLDFALRLEVGPASITRIEWASWGPTLRGLNDLSASRT